MPITRFTEEERMEIKTIVHEALAEYFTTKGKLGKSVLVTTAIIIGSVVAIFGGIKTILAWIGIIITRS